MTVEQLQHKTFAAVSRGLDRQSPPMHLFEKAKRLGIWNPSDIDFSRDRVDWQGFSDLEQTVLLHLTSLFQAGEEAVTLDLLPLIMTIAREGRVEEEIYLTSFLWEEAKHTDFFRRFLDEVAGSPTNLDRFFGENYQGLICSALPDALNRLVQDPSPAAQIEASVTYNLIVEGVLAETGYHAYYTILERNDLLPGVRRGIRLLKQDEARHIAYGVYLLSRLIAASPELWDVLDARMTALLPQAIGVIGDLFSTYDSMPFGLVEDDFITFAIDQFSHRYERLEKARGASLPEINSITARLIDDEIGT
jgi:ribonucleoside-diphosphate reductase beta chain